MIPYKENEIKDNTADLPTEDCTLSTISKEWINGKDTSAQRGVEDTTIKKHPTRQLKVLLNQNLLYLSQQCIW